MKNATNRKTMKKETPTLTIKQYVIEAGELVGEWPSRSQWDKGVKYYAHLLLLGLVECSHADEELKPEELKSLLLNGASSFESLSHGGGYIPFTREEIENILCTNSNRGKCSLTKLMNAQTRALYQAYIALRHNFSQIANIYNL